MYRRSCLIASIALAFLAPVAVTAGSAGPRPVLERSFVVVLDPGHGGDNEGCLGFDGQTREKDVSLALALELAGTLQRRLPGARIVLTRERDRMLPLQERVAFANAQEADLFISLHANASESRTQEGFETYVVDAEASGREAARLARRENDAVLAEVTSAEDQPVATMIRQLAMRRDRRAAVRLASAVQRAQRERFPDRIDRGVKQAPFDVLLGARMPAILFEAGFLDHEREGPLLLDARARAAIADGLADAIIGHYRSSAR